MLEPTWNTAGGLRKSVPAARRVVEDRDQRSWWLVEAAPWVVAAVWIGITLAAMVGGVATGRRELLDWCRSDAGVAVAGTVTALAALVATARRGVRR